MTATDDPGRAERTILVQTVGTGRPPAPDGEDPGNPVWEALAFGVRERRPAMLVQWCSAQSKADTLPRFEAVLGPGERPVDVRHHVCEDPNDAEALTLAYVRALDELKAEHPGARIEVDFTSGTKAMSAAAVAAAVARRVPRLHYAVGPRDTGGRATATDRLVSIETTRIVADRLLQELGRLFNEGQFIAVHRQAAALAEDIAEDGELHLRASTLAFMARAYELWDRFDWAGAFAHLRQYRDHEPTGKEPEPVRERKDRRFSRMGWDLEQLGRHVQHLQRCKQNKDLSHCPELLADLLASVDRRMQQGRYDDAVARLYRLTEMLGQMRLMRLAQQRKLPVGPAQGNPTQAVPRQTLEALAPQCARAGLSGETVTLGLDQTLHVLDEAGDAIASDLKASYGERQHWGPLGAALQSRNNSLLAHGLQPVQHETAAALREQLLPCLERHVQAEGQDLAMLLGAATFQGCPWTTTPAEAQAARAAELQ